MVDAVLRPLVLARCACVAAVAVACSAVHAQTLQAKARESGCQDVPKVVEGTMYKCTTSTGASAYFNVPEPGAERAPVRKAAAGSTPAVGGPAVSREPAPAGFPRVDPGTQKGRDDMRRKVLQDELATEEKLLGEARAAYNNGAPAALAEEQANPQRYADRIARLRQAVQLHERNVDALRRELGLPR
jgi:hypothetical protein